MAETDGGSTAAGRTQALDRAIVLLRAVADADPDRATPAALASATGLNRATAWRLLTTLESHGLVDRDPVSGRCSIGYAMVELAGSAGAAGLINTARPVLERVSEQTGETASLAVVRGTTLHYVDEVAPPRVVRAQWVGRPVSLHATSTGKALMAWLPAVERDAMLDHKLTAYTDATFVNRARFLEELAATRDRGYGECRGEFESSLFGVSAPVLDAHERPYAVLSIWGPRERVTEARFPLLGEKIREAAIEVARARRALGTS